jgi:hypothetical protein
VTLHSSWRGITLSLLGALTVFLIGAFSVASVGGGVVPIGLLILGTSFLMAFLFDYPIAATITADAVQRRALLRRHTIVWGRVDQLTRARPAVTMGFRQLTPGGLTAKVGRRRYLLVDQCESMAEFEVLGEVLKDRYAGLGVDEMIIPPETIDPTWTYRRRRWQPETSA